MFESTIKGFLTELKCEEAFTERGILLSKPIIVDSRYDFIADVNNRFIRIQCKTSRILDELEYSFQFACSSKNWNTYEVKTYDGEIDYFYTYMNENHYLIPVDEAPKREMTLRTDSDSIFKNNASNWDNLYLLDIILKNELNYDSEEKVKELRKNYIEAMQRRQKAGKGVCVDCGKPTSAPSIIRCLECYKAAKNEEWEKTHLSREELKKLIRTTAFKQIGEMYNVSDNTIRRWCDKLGLPRRTLDIKKIKDEEWNNI